MRSLDRGYTTNPMRVGAPLPEDLEALPVNPSVEEIGAELDRAEVELMHALAKHRKAWSLMRKWSKHRADAAESPGMLASLESDPVWKKRTGDVGWWRSEMEARSATVLALGAMLDRRRSGPPARAHFLREPEGAQVFGWPIDGSKGRPNKNQYEVAKAWLVDHAHSNRPVEAAMVRAIEQLVATYEGANPDAVR